MVKMERATELYRELAEIAWESQADERNQGFLKEFGIKEEPKYFAPFLEGFTYALYHSLIEKYTEEIEELKDAENWRPKCIFPEQR